MEATIKLIKELESILPPGSERNLLLRARKELGIDSVEIVPSILIEGRQIEQGRCIPEYTYEMSYKNGDIIIKVRDKNHPEFFLDLKIAIITLAKAFQ